MGALGLVSTGRDARTGALEGMRGAAEQHELRPDPPDLARPAQARKVKSGQAGLRKVVCGLDGAGGSARNIRETDDKLTECPA